MPPSAATVGGGAAPGSGGQGAVAAGSISAGGGGGGVAGEMASTELLSQFVRSDFDTNDYLRAAVRKDSVAEDLSHLKQGISALEAQLRQQVVSHHDRLIEQVSHAKDLEALVGTVSAGVSNLQDSLNKVVKPFKSLSPRPSSSFSAPSFPVTRLIDDSVELRLACTAISSSEHSRREYARP
jgi:hypothetical protein